FHSDARAVKQGGVHQPRPAGALTACRISGHAFYVVRHHLVPQAYIHLPGLAQLNRLLAWPPRAGGSEMTAAGQPARLGIATCDIRDKRLSLLGVTQRPFLQKEGVGILFSSTEICSGTLLAHRDASDSFSFDTQ